MPISPLPFDLTHEEREELQLLQAGIDLHPERLIALLAELLLLRDIRAWAMEHRDRFPPRLRAKLTILGQRAALRRLVADSREEIQG
jgi:hypothetical protein